MIKNLRVIYRDNEISYDDGMWECDGYWFNSERDAEEYVDDKYLDNNIW